MSVKLFAKSKDCLFHKCNPLQQIVDFVDELRIGTWHVAYNACASRKSPQQQQPHANFKQISDHL